MTDLPPALKVELGKLLAVLQQDTGEAAPRVVVVRGALRASVGGSVLSLPSSYVDHWNRFNVVPTAMIRDVAYSLKKTSLLRHGGLKPQAVEADAMAYAELVLRTVNETE
ncbi:MAG TPA: hypothetical protein VI818_07705 [Candidatus Thermoplasmatota archaeon]|nr:hypothetical protein [Candidatus Thermoplasmatota archaeon]